MKSMTVERLLAMITLSVLVQFPVQAAEYRIDPAHTFIEFEISHLGYSIVVGRFDKFSGAFGWDKARPGASGVEVKVSTASVNTNWAKRDEHIRSVDFLDVEKYPSAIFRSTAYHGDSGGGTLDGLLTLHGITRPISLKVKSVGEGPDPWGGYRAGFRASTTLRRSDFGITHDLGPTAETMEFNLFVEGVRK